MLKFAQVAAKRWRQKVKPSGLAPKPTWIIPRHPLLLRRLILTANRFVRHAELIL